VESAARAAGPAVARPNTLPERAHRACSVSGDRLHLDVVSRPGVICVLLAGELDFCALAELATRLEQLEVDDHVLVHLELTHLSFADVAAIRLLGGFARRLRRTGHVVVTTGATRTLLKVAGLLGVADDLGLP
jgi:ABC-type transporter Mla MlaB component